MDFDTEKFILQVKERPALWDNKCADYSDRNKKLKYWEEIINIYSKEDDTLKEREELGRVLMKKWRNIKDNFVKASKQLKKAQSGSNVKCKSPYAYYNVLLFLNESSFANDSESDIANTTSHDLTDPYETPPNPKKSKKMKNDAYIEQQLMSVLNKNLNYRTGMDHDDDKFFLLSLLGEFKKIPDSNKLEARCDIMRVIKEAQQPFHYNNSNTPWNRQHPNQSCPSQYADREFPQVFVAEYAPPGYQSSKNLPSTSTSNSSMPNIVNIKKSPEFVANQDECSLMSDLCQSP